MAVYTQLLTQDVQRFLQEFDIGECLRLEGIAQGIVNSNYRLQTTQGGYILTLIESSGPETDLPYLLALQAHLGRAGLPVPVPVANRSGNCQHRLKGKETLLANELPGSSPLVPNAAQCHQGGAVMARMHRSSAGFTPRRDNPMSMSVLLAKVARLQPRLQEDDPDLMRCLEEEFENAGRGFYFESLPTGLCHADLFPDNTLFQGDALTGLIDFHYACHERFLLDLATAINAWCFQETEARFDNERVQALWAGYRAHREPSDMERLLLRNALRASCLRFLTTRLEARYFPRAANQSLKPPEAFLKRLMIHRTEDITAGLP
ncbi:MAG: homoserine kinase [Magnetococcales bacterium]|nr:homoserine kinase [Magnetococcales bacterium]